MGLNLVIGCHRCREKVWTYRGCESMPFHDFWRFHWDHEHKLQVASDQDDGRNPWVNEYADVGGSFGVEHPDYGEAS